MARDLKLGERVLVSAAGWNESNAGESGEIIKAPWYSHIDEVEWCRVRLDSGREIQSETFALTRVPKCGTCGLAAPDGTCPDCDPAVPDMGASESAPAIEATIVPPSAALDAAPIPPTCGTCGGALVPASVDPAMAGWCEKCQTWGIGALELARHTEGFKFWDRFPVDEPFRRVPPIQPKREMFPVQQNPTVRDLLADRDRSKAIAEFLIYLGSQGVHLAEYAGGGIEPRVSSELSRERLSEVIADFQSRP